MPKPASHACPNCGAPLAVSEGATAVTCQPCGSAIRVEWNRRAPVGRVPPLTVYVPPRATLSGVALVAAALVLIGLGVSVVIYFRSSPGRGVDQTVQRLDKGQGAPNVVFPAICEANGTLELENRVYEGSGTLITAEANCKVKIRNSQLKSDIVVLANKDAIVEITHSTLEGRDIAVKATSNSKLRVSDKSVIKGKSAAVEAGMNAQLTLADSRFEGEEVGILANKNIEAAIKRCHVQGQKYAVKSDVNLKLHAVDSTFQAEEAALHTATNLEFVAQGGTVRGSDAAFLVKAFMPSIRLSGGALVETKGTAIEAEANLKLYMDDATILAGRIGVDAKANAQVDMRPKSRIHAGQVGLLFTVNADVTLRKATLESDRHAICAEFNTALVAEDSAITAKEDALRMQAKPRRFDVGSSQIVGNKNYTAKDCGI